MAVFSKTPGGKQMIFLCINRWAGVSGSRSFGLSEFAVRALPLRIRSTSVRTTIFRTVSTFNSSVT